MVSSRKPEVVFFAGPNGSGKSTLTGILKPAMAYINADDIKVTLHCSDMEAAVLAEEQRERYLSEKTDFCFETVLSTDRNLKLLQRAKKVGYFLRCYYVLTYSPIINILRVNSWVADGGHPVPEEKIVTRYSRALGFIPDLVSLCDICHMYDNSGTSMFRIFKKRKTEFFCDTNQFWPLSAIEKLTGIHHIEKTDLNITQAR